ncbi:MAG: hypothetical protein HY040_23930 [Planctomycetes bacterium]|nr:hypothetical protein [Planctomycetota bacterium]
MEVSSNQPKSMDVLQKQYNNLRDKKIAAEANLETSEGNLKKLRKQACDSYGSDDLEDLRKQLDHMKVENERKRAEYQAHLSEIENQLAQVEAGHAEIADKEAKK